MLMALIKIILESDPRNPICWIVTPRPVSPHLCVLETGHSMIDSKPTNKFEIGFNKPL